MTTSDVEEHRKHVRVYLKVFYTLLVLTVATVAAAAMNVPLVWAIAVALSIAAFKGSLVAWHFMHLKSERGMLFSILALVVVFFAALLFLPFLVDQETSKYRTDAPIPEHTPTPAEGH